MLSLQLKEKWNKIQKLMKALIEKNPKIFLIAIVSVLFFLILFFAVQYQKTKSELAKVKNDYLAASSKDEKQKILEEVGKLIILPTDESPNVATVSDVDKLKQTQPFFNKAKNGDKVLVYTRLAILYDPALKKIIDIAHISQTASGSQSPLPTGNQATPPPTPIPTIAPTQTPAPTPAPTPLSITATYKFALYNGTKTIGLTKTFETTTLKTKLPNAVVVKRADAKKDYSSTILVDISSKADEAIKIADLLNIAVESLPEGETKPDNTDFLIILGTSTP